MSLLPRPRPDPEAVVETGGRLAVLLGPAPSEAVDGWLNHFIDNIFRGFQKSGTKNRVVSHFVPLRRLYDVLFAPSFAVRERNAGYCEKRRDCIT